MSTHDLLRQSIRKPKDLNTLRRGERATARLARAFEKLVQIARLDTGASAPQIKTFPLQPLLQEIADNYQQQAKEQSLLLSIESCENG